MLHYAKQERLAKDKKSSYFGPFASYEENEMSPDDEAEDDEGCAVIDPVKKPKEN